MCLHNTIILQKCNITLKSWGRHPSVTCTIGRDTPPLSWLVSRSFFGTINLKTNDKLLIKQLTEDTTRKQNHVDEMKIQQMAPQSSSLSKLLYTCIKLAISTRPNDQIKLTRTVVKVTVHIPSSIQLHSDSNLRDEINFIKGNSNQAFFKLIQKGFKTPVRHEKWPAWQKFHI